MRGLKKLSFIILPLFIGCTPLQTYNVINQDSIPKGTYTIYSYSFAGRLRVALLINPESNVQINPYSGEILVTRGTFHDAMAYMKGGVYKDVEIESVVYKGRTVGYLLAYKERGVITDPVYLEANLFEINKKIYFDVSVKNYGGGGHGKRGMKK